MNRFFKSFSIGKLVVVAVLLAGIGIPLLRWNASNSSGTVDVTMPKQLSAVAQDGKILFAANCAACHGKSGGGTDHGPPLIHDIYNPGHHADYAFVVAARNGVRAHHWPYGNMPPQPQVTEAQVMTIVQYIREVQQANGITYRPHQM